MSESITPLPLSCRTSDDDYPGKVAQLGPDWRLSVSMNADRYSLQQRTPSGPGRLRVVLALAHLKELS